MIHGHCLAGATQLCVCCDVIFTAEDARIGFPSIPAGAGLIAQTWMWHVGPHRAKYMSFLPGSQISGKDAEAFGFATRAFAPDELEAETYAYAARIAKVPADLLRIKKTAVNRVMDLNGFRAAIMYGAEWGLHIAPDRGRPRSPPHDRGAGAARRDPVVPGLVAWRAPAGCYAYLCRPSAPGF